MTSSPKPTVCLFFQAHQPLRLREYDFFQIGSSELYFDEKRNAAILDRVCDQSYLPACAMFQRINQETNGACSFALGLSGTLLQQLERHRPDALEAFQDLVNREIAFLTSGTYSHSLAALHSKQELSRQIQLHREILWRLFHKRPRTFANTELIYRDNLAEVIHSYGFTTALVEGVTRYLGYRSPDYLYSSEADSQVRVFTRNAGLSCDLSSRFSDPSWCEYPLNADTFISWLLTNGGPIRNLFLDLESIGETQTAETGIFQFWESFIKRGINAGLRFESPSKVIRRFKAVDTYSSPQFSSWAGDECAEFLWKSNVMQHEAEQKLYRLQHSVRAANNRPLLDRWSQLQAVDHFRQMSTRDAKNTAINRNQHASSDPYEFYLSYMNALSDLQIRASTALSGQTNSR